jgi:hypothetical protein
MAQGETERYLEAILAINLPKSPRTSFSLDPAKLSSIFAFGTKNKKLSGIDLMQPF